MSDFEDVDDSLDYEFDEGFPGADDDTEGPDDSLEVDAGDDDDENDDDAQEVDLGDGKSIVSLAR